MTEFIHGFTMAWGWCMQFAGMVVAIMLSFVIILVLPTCLFLAIDKKYGDKEKEDK